MVAAASSLGAIAVSLRSLSIAFPLFALSALFLILYLDAIGQAREASLREWATLHPVSARGTRPAGTDVQDSAETDVPQPQKEA